MNVYHSTVLITRTEIERWNFLLNKDIPQMSDEEIEKYHAKSDDYEGGIIAEFEDGSHITIDLCSGDNNYYDDSVWFSPDETTYVNFECSYSIAQEGSDEFQVNGDTYIIDWEIAT